MSGFRAGFPGDFPGGFYDGFARFPNGLTRGFSNGFPNAFPATRLAVWERAVDQWLLEFVASAKLQIAMPGAVELIAGSLGQKPPGSLPG